MCWIRENGGTQQEGGVLEVSTKGINEGRATQSERVRFSRMSVSEET